MKPRKKPEKRTSKLRFLEAALSPSYPFFTLLLLMILSGSSSAQKEGEECGEPEGFWVKRLYKKGKDRSSGDIRERNEHLKKAVDKDPECAKCHFQLAENLFIVAKQKAQVSYDNALEHYLKAIELCPKLHSNIYFQIGLIYYGKKRYGKAIEYFQEFLDFNVDDDSKYDDEYAKKYKDTKGMMSELRALRDLHQDTVPFDPHLVEGVSSRKADEYLPMLSPDNQLMFYTRRYRKKSKNEIVPKRVEELTMSERAHPGARFSDGRALGPPFNQDEKENYGGVAISVDNKELYVTICKQAKKGYKNCDIYRSDYKLTGKNRYEWSTPENLGPKVNTEGGWESQPSLSADGNTLYFATVRKNTRNTDIYVTHRQPNGEWGEAYSIGDSINTDGDEKAPFIHSDSETLYFSSNEHLGMGKYDIFFSRKKGDSSWTEPENIGKPINTRNEEIGMIVSTDGKKAYFSSSRLDTSKGLDIYSFEVPEEARPENVKVVKGKVLDQKGQPVSGAKVRLKNANSEETSTAVVDSGDGKFAAVVKADEDEDVLMSIENDGYAFKAKAFGKDEESRESSKGAEPESSLEITEVKMKKLETGAAYRIDDIHYATNKAELTDRSKAILDEFIRYLKKNENLKVAIHGHTDNVGSKKDNQALSHDRAFTVMSYLQRKGVDSDRLEFKGFGESRPIATNETPEGRAKNRRTEFKVLEK